MDPVLSRYPLLSFHVTAQLEATGFVLGKQVPLSSTQGKQEGQEASFLAWNQQEKECHCCSVPSLQVGGILGPKAQG